MKYYLGMDLGTGSIKTALFDRTGTLIASASEDYPLYQPENGWSEQDPEDWYRAAVKTVRAVMERSKAAPGDIRALGIAGQMMGAVFLGRDGVPLRRAILWNDGRTTQACEQLRETVGDELFLKYSLTPARPGLTAAKIQWVREHQPEIFRKTARILLPKDYLRFRFTGKCAAEVSDASATQLLDIPKRRWAPEILRRMRISEDLLGPVLESPEIAGTVTPQAACDMGITGDCIVAAGAGDNAAAGVGTGIVKPGLSMTTIGTSGTVFAYSEQPAADPARSVYTFCMPVPGAWHFMGSVNSCGGALKWWRAAAYPHEKDYRKIDEDAASSVPGANRLLFLPYLNGEQSPHFDLTCRGAFVGLAAIHTKADMTRAVLEGATFALRDILNGIRGCGVIPESVRMCGGGSKSAFWRRLLCDIYNLPVALPDMDSENSAALGAAILAMTAAGEYPDVPAACGTIIRVSGTVCTPDPENAAAYDRIYRVFDSLYPKLRDSFWEILSL